MKGKPHNYPHERLPHYVYRCFNEAGALLYVGCSVQPEVRVKDHRCRAPWGAEIATVRTALYPNRREALTGEREAIWSEAPRWNIKGLRCSLEATA